ncbi:MAG: hypothetical protein KAI18_03855 [Candidatus Aenigmarchaeota archaeon]|nr:hypothetical protein [Candidatus Aenigmarchaeota archaeon]
MVSLSKIVSLIVITFSFWNMVVSRMFEVIKTLTCTTSDQTLKAHYLTSIEDNNYYFNLFNNSELMMAKFAITGEQYQM